MTESTACDQSPGTTVLICGAGAAGLTLAIELARRGCDFRLIERRDAPFEGSRGKGLQPRTLEVFEDLGVLDRIAAVGQPYPPLRTYDDKGGFLDTDLIEARSSTPSEPYPLPIMLPQCLTEQVLRDRLAELGSRVDFGMELTAFESDAQGVTAHVTNGDTVTTLRAAWLVGTDGGRSTVRRLAGIDFPGRTLGVRALVADVALTGLSRDAWHRFNPDDMDRQVSICPLPGTDLFQIQAPIALEGEPDLSADGLTALVATRTGRSDVRVSAVSWASAYAMNARLADRYRAGRVLLAGDAAHTHPPTGGQGLNTSVQDAYNLGWKLSAVGCGAPLMLLDSYEAERRPIAADMLGLSTQLLERMKTGDLSRDRRVRQLDLGYRGSVLTVPAPDRSEVLLNPGDRAPDAPCRGAAGQPTRLFHVLQGAHWTLLIHGQADESGPTPRAGLRICHVGPEGDLVDEGGHIARAYGLQPGQQVLIRPDGYIAAILNVTDGDALAACLAWVRT
ncbi:2-polyprenyl-6-methoxyphenol hydroxylase [Ameyamaea chiangmaiensis NBRC 103196]|uniref:FAD-dependent oxidoreductase n=1 Tax=Ameyamaea chiangmaiensis TaxID=442969 RepID=A0A850PH57_9PROT|nr:FAD-dependent oxidoreductase [Ameyamaea chiangmaiensis]MBS4074792.1 FAD-dependent oxidoreductase [Ameyamaea chiangmaiensis]NVN41576.1 FAD-dependent oxidoreductase [Ameyamaea chiangmaiensis]GBQ62753.1 2-polyprenyl-6-methoxyphenol hydroxylase [Ameyamaea chiangmaiensis NBRC 103196]